MTDDRNIEYPLLALAALIGLALGAAGGCAGGTSDERNRANETFCKPVCGKSEARIDVINTHFQCFCEAAK